MNEEIFPKHDLISTSPEEPLWGSFYQSVIHTVRSCLSKTHSATPQDMVPVHWNYQITLRQAEERSGISQGLGGRFQLMGWLTPLRKSPDTVSEPEHCPLRQRSRLTPRYRRISTTAWPLPSLLLCPSIPGWCHSRLSLANYWRGGQHPAPFPRLLPLDLFSLFTRVGLLDVI